MIQRVNALEPIQSINPWSATRPGIHTSSVFSMKVYFVREESAAVGGLKHKNRVEGNGRGRFRSSRSVRE